MFRPSETSAATRLLAGVWGLSYLAMLVGLVLVMMSR